MNHTSCLQQSTSCNTRYKITTIVHKEQTIPSKVNQCCENCIQLSTNNSSSRSNSLLCIKNIYMILLLAAGILIHSQFQYKCVSGVIIALSLIALKGVLINISNSFVTPINKNLLNYIKSNTTDGYIIIDKSQILYHNDAAAIMFSSKPIQPVLLLAELRTHFISNSTIYSKACEHLSNASIGYREHFFVDINSKCYSLEICTLTLSSVLLTFSYSKYYDLYLKSKNESEAKDLMIGSSAHEIRNSLQSFTTFLELANQNSSTESSPYLKQLEYSKDNLFIVIKDLLDFSLLRKGLLEINNSKVNIAELVNNIVVSYKQACEIKGISIVSILDSSLPTVIFTDKGRLTQIIINLVTNAIKFTKCGTIKIKLTPLPNQKLLLSVEDSGIGIKDSDKNKLFSAFSKLKQETDINPHGLGLGLMITHKLSLLLGEGISFSSQIGIGTTFNVVLNSGLSVNEYNNCLTINEANDLESINEHIDINSNHSSGLPQFIGINNCKFSNITLKQQHCNCPSVIEVDDNPFNLYSLKKMTEKENISSKQFADPTECLMFIKNCLACNVCNGTQLKLVFMDLNMPIMNGCDCLKNIRLIEGMNKIKVYAISGDSLCANEEKYKLINTGFNGVLQKPIEKSQFLKIIWEHISPLLV